MTGYAPENWNYERDGRPDVVYMQYEGGDRAQIQEKYKSFGGREKTAYDTELPLRPENQPGSQLENIFAGREQGGVGPRAQTGPRRKDTGAADKGISRPPVGDREGLLTEGPPVRWSNQLRLYRTINPKKTRELIEDVTREYPGVPDLVRKIRANKEELFQTVLGRTLTSFSTEVVRKYHDIETTRLPKAAYYPSVPRDRPNFLARAVSAVAESARMGRHDAPGRKLKTGRLASEGREIEHFGVAWAVRRGEFWAESPGGFFHKRIKVRFPFQPTSW